MTVLGNEYKDMKALTKKTPKMIYQEANIMS